MSLTLTLTPAACKKAYKEFGQALNEEIANQMVAHFNAERGKIIGETHSCPQEIVDILQSSLAALLQKVGKKEKKEKQKKVQKKAKRGIRRRFKYKGEDQKGKNGAYLRITVDRETRIVSKINETNWSDHANRRYKKVFGTSTAYIIPSGSGKKANIVVTSAYKKKSKK